MRSTKVQVLVNGSSGKEIVCKKGLRQGDLLSPLMFILVADRLNRMFERKKLAGWI